METVYHDSGLTNEQYEDLCKQFSYLANSQSLKWDDLSTALKTLNVPLAGHEIREVAGVPRDSVTMKEFVDLYQHACEMKDNTKMIKKTLLLKAVTDVKAFTSDKNSDIRHSISKAEERGFTLWINKRLEKDADLNPGILPVDVAADGQLYERCKNGILLCKLVNLACPDTVDERSINKLPTIKNQFHMNENLNLAINSAASIGCCIVNIGPGDITAMKQHIVLGLIWQLIRKGLVDTITLTQHNELITLLKENETAEDLLRLKPEELLIRWVNYHLEKSGIAKRMTNFHTDLQSSEVYVYLLNQIAPADKRGALKSPQEIMACASVKDRAVIVLNNAELLNAKTFISPEDIYTANEDNDRLHLAFLANLFNMYPGLDTQTEVNIENETLEERTYKNWMNSLGVKPFVSFLETDLHNGLILLQLIDIIQPGTVDWSKVVYNFDPKKQLFQELGNCNLVITYAASIKIKFVNVDGRDLQQRNKKLILGAVFQLMHAYTYKLLNEATGKGTLMERDEKVVLKWANEQLTEAKANTLNSYRDPALSTGLPILQILEQIRPGSTNRDLWNDSKGEALSSCAYAISCCRKAGACVYALPEHLNQLNGKMIQTVLVCLQALDYSIRRRAEQPTKQGKKSKGPWTELDDENKSSSDSD